MCDVNLEITEIIKEIENRKKTGELSKKRVTCAHCENTWIELVGFIVGHKEGDVFEIMFADEVSEEVPLSFKGIKKVSRGRLL